jgi:FMN phosphatase YigB (HAD superfamily)
MANFYPPGYEEQLTVVAIDFDGVLHNADKGWGNGTCYGDPLPGSIEAIKELSKKYKIIIFTAKAKPDRPLVNNKTGTELVQ